MRVAVFDVSHWHFPLYVAALQDPGIEVVGISDSQTFSGQRVAEQLDCKLYASNEALLREDFDFALVFSQHSEMGRLAERLIGRGTPFLIEKPCGLTLQEVRRIRRMADEKGVYVSVPFILRMSELGERLSPSEGFTPEGYQHLSFRFIAGPIERYEHNGCNWMLDKRLAGGGSMLNLAVHFVELITYFTNAPITEVSAQIRTYRPDVTVEEQSVFTCRNAAGQIGVIETGYLYPATPEDQREFTFAISHASSYVKGYADQLYIKERGQKAGRAATVEYNTDTFYSPFLRRSWADVLSGRPPVVGLREAEHAIAVVEAGYRSALNGGALQAVEPALSNNGG